MIIVATLFSLKEAKCSHKIITLYYQHIRGFATRTFTLDGTWHIEQLKVRKINVFLP